MVCVYVLWYMWFIAAGRHSVMSAMWHDEYCPRVVQGWAKEFGFPVAWAISAYERS
ncbi:MAG: hypothetical protein NVSMB44_34150 [Ktedonobacteraceae bacterium]